MLTIQQIDTNSPDQVNRFVDIPYRLYANCPHWLPPPRDHEASYLNGQEHPFYEHSEADFFIAVRDGRDVGRIAVLAHALGHELYGVSEPHFYLFECEDDQEAANALFQQAFAWARARGFNSLVGPLGFTVLDGLCLLVDGFDYPQVTTMNPYNPAYYTTLIEAAGFVQYGEDTASYHLDVANIHLPAWVAELAENVKQKHDLYMSNLTSIEEFLTLGPDLLQFLAIGTGNDLSRLESRYIIHQIQSMIDPRLIQVIRRRQGGAISKRRPAEDDMAKDDIVAVTFGFPNLATTLKQANGQVSTDDLRTAMTNTTSIIANGIMIDPDYHIMGLSALLFCEMTEMARKANIQDAYMVHVGGPDNRMADDMSVLDAQPVHWHRTYAREV
ncbi:MAG: hypothetical protein AAF702_41095 [Chloroflexota bacterium]